MRKRNIVIGLIALEILALPAAAHLHANLKLTERTNVIAAEIKSTGLKRYFVSSDGPFAVTVKNMKGQARINVFEAGKIGEASFGENAQLPGPPTLCAQTNGEIEQIIYTADRGTIRNPGGAISHAVLFSISFEKGTTPDIEFMPIEKSGHIIHASTCM